MDKTWAILMLVFAISSIIVEIRKSNRINHCTTCLYRKCTSNHSPCIDCVNGSEYETDKDVAV